MNNTLKKMAETDGTILITGRTGTGKSHLAQEIHRASPRRAGKFVAINLATLSENIIESELFGHERGAFSGADSRRVGKLECANGGTVFLDEIGELPTRLQTKLLEALNSHVISPVGSNREIQLNVRIITATNRDLATMVRARQFREDLFYRINTFQVQLPDLHTDGSRVLNLAESFVVQAAQRQNRPVPIMGAEFRRELLRCRWPGNVRELKNAMEYAVAMNVGDALTPACLPATAPPEENQLAAFPTFPTDYREAKTYFEKSYLQEILLRFEGRINLTAKRTGLSKVTLIDKIRRYEIDIPTIKYQAHVAQESRISL
jgi:transcriptional regulator with PAS, ATPase and Fis domain